MLSVRDSYFQSRYLSKSAIDRLLECEAKYKAWLDGEEDQEETKALIFGGMFHKLTLEPEDFDKEYAVTDLNLTTKPGREWKKALPPGISITKEGDYESALLMAQAIKDHPQTKYLFQDFIAEKPIYWTRPDGIKCKALPDMRSMVNRLRFCVDLKSTESVNPRDIQRTIANYNYHRQAAWYLDGMEAVGEPCEDFIFIFVEKSFPYLVTPCVLDAEAIAKGREDNERAVERLKKCHETGLYPCYTRNIETISLPPWAL